MTNVPEVPVPVASEKDPVPNGVVAKARKLLAAVAPLDGRDDGVTTPWADWYADSGAIAGADDRALIAAAPRLITQLCDEVERLQAQRAKVVTLASGYVGDGHVFPGATDPVCGVSCSACAAQDILETLATGGEPR